MESEQEVIEGDCLEVLKRLADCSIDAVVTDPPYGMSKDPDIAEVMKHWLAGDVYEHNSQGFMGKSWDSFVPGPEYWREVYRVLKPGGHLLAFSSTRTDDLLSIAIRFAGFERRDEIRCEGAGSLSWNYGSGFPKSLDAAKAIAQRRGGALRAQEAIAFMQKRREDLGQSRQELELSIFGRSDGNVRNWEEGISLPRPGLWPRIRDALLLASTPYDEDMTRGDLEIGSEEGSFGYQKDGDRWEQSRTVRILDVDAAKRWQGWGTALKPAWEPVLVFRKPIEGTVAANVLKYGTGAINIDACRIATGDKVTNHARSSDAAESKGIYGDSKAQDTHQTAGQTLGRWPANVVFCHLDECIDGKCVDGCPVATLDIQSGTVGAAAQASGDTLRNGNTSVSRGRFNGLPENQDPPFYSDKGGASRFFYVAKAARSEREVGCEHLLPRSGAEATSSKEGAARLDSPRTGAGRTASQVRNFHPTVKPIALMRWLIRLVTPPGGVLLDPFVGSGTTLCAAALEGVNAIGIEREPDYVNIARARIFYWQNVATQGLDEKTHKSVKKLDAEQSVVVGSL